MGWEIIADGYDKTIDSYRETIDNSNLWLANYQAELCETYGISNLKIKYTGASWYFIEVAKSQVSKVPDEFVHKQTLVNASRFSTQALQEFEVKMREAQDNKASKEYEIFTDIREQVLDAFAPISQAGEQAAYIDFISSLSETAYKNNYNKPEIVEWYDLEIKSGRHPVIEQSVSDFISNDLELQEQSFSHIITGPNMGGKSTFLRQNALIILMAHLGSYVPAASAKIPLTDKIFSRVWASDNLFLGQSTFMVEMQEVANILNNSTKNSFVIIDEIGRWTSTYDGMSLAWAILKHNHDAIGAKTLFATHYHELIDESVSLNWVKNFSVAVGENSENLVFLRKIIPGGIKKSFGLEVARIAGVSDNIIAIARDMLKQLEVEHNKLSATQLSFIPETTLVEPEPSQVEEELKNIDVNNLTPMQALTLLSELKNKI